MEYGERPRRTQATRPYRRNTYFRASIPNPCSFHTALGVPAQHADVECRDPRHPKNQRKKETDRCTQNAQANEAYNDVKNYQTRRQNAEWEEMGKFLLDSAAHPTHVKLPYPSMQSLSHKLLIETPTDHDTPCTHVGIMQITPRSSEKALITTAVANPKFRQNLLSVHDLVTR